MRGRNNEFLEEKEVGGRISVFSIVVFGSIVNEGYVNRLDETQEHCIFNRNRNACNYGITVGVLAFLSCLLYLALDAYFPQISSVKDRKKAVLSDIGVSAFWAFLWFVGFCFLTNQWQASKEVDNPMNEGGDAARAAITFSFFSIFTWVSTAAIMLGVSLETFNMILEKPAPQASSSLYVRGLSHHFHLTDTKQRRELQAGDYTHLFP
uniref:Synaptogyrin 1 n=1 Tax=Athene cunicularia TaxID=194338 RepID=A0A663MKX5_ATHCN